MPMKTTLFIETGLCQEEESGHIPQMEPPPSAELCLRAATDPQLLIDPGCSICYHCLELGDFALLPFMLCRLFSQGPSGCPQASSYSHVRSLTPDAPEWVRNAYEEHSFCAKELHDVTVASFSTGWDLQFLERKKIAILDSGNSAGCGFCREASVLFSWPAGKKKGGCLASPLSLPCCHSLQLGSEQPAVWEEGNTESSPRWFLSKTKSYLKAASSSAWEHFPVASSRWTKAVSLKGSVADILSAGWTLASPKTLHTKHCFTSQECAFGLIGWGWRSFILAFKRRSERKPRPGQLAVW